MNAGRYYYFTIKGESVEVILGKYSHYKGKDYELLMVARRSETEEKMDIYKMLYGEGDVWVRPYEMFMEMVEVDGLLKPRFEKVDDVN
jgi:hypothetical protein